MNSLFEWSMLEYFLRILFIHVWCNTTNVLHWSKIYTYSQTHIWQQSYEKVSRCFLWHMNFHWTPAKERFRVQPSFKFLISERYSYEWIFMVRGWAKSEWIPFVITSFRQSRKKIFFYWYFSRRHLWKESFD